MRQIVLDTETTGLEVDLGHRVIEIGAVEILNRRLTGRHFHHYLNPDRESDEAALRVHGISNEFLQDKPRFREVAAELLEYVRGAELIIHNANFDVGFLDAELRTIDLPPITEVCERVTDSLRLARELHPGKRNGLDALCERYAIDNSARTLHGALLDAQLLAEVYLAMTRGQDSLLMDLPQERADELDAATSAQYDLIVLAAEPAEAEAHERYLDDLDKASKGACVWRRMTAD